MSGKKEKKEKTASKALAGAKRKKAVEAKAPSSEEQHEPEAETSHDGKELVTPAQVLAFLNIQSVHELSSEDRATLVAAAQRFTQRVKSADSVMKVRAKAGATLLRFLHKDSRWKCHKYGWNCRPCGSDYHSMWRADLTLARTDTGAPVRCKVMGRSGCVDNFPGACIWLEGTAVIPAGTEDEQDTELQMSWSELNVPLVRELLGATEEELSAEQAGELFQEIAAAMGRVGTLNKEIMEDNANYKKMLGPM